MITLLKRLAAWTTRRRRDAELREELAQHRRWRTEALMSDGLPEEEARRQAAVSVGNVTKLREDARDVWGFPSIDSVAQDVRYGLRQLRRAPVFTAVAVGSLALAIGAGSAVFALSRAALFRPVAIFHPEQLLTLRWHATTSNPTDLFNGFNGSSSADGNNISGTSFSHVTLEHMAEQASPFADVGGFADLYRANLKTQGQSRLVKGEMVSGSYFPLLGVRPSIGRLLQPGDDTPASSAVVISYRLWKERFGSDPAAIGMPLQVNAVPFTVVGVTDPSFGGTLDVGDVADVFVPFGARDRIMRDEESWKDPNYWWVQILVRPRPGASEDALRARLETVLRRDIRAVRPVVTDAALPVLQLHPGAYGQPYTRESLREPLRIMVLAVCALLLIACANIAGLQVARAAAREREMAVRLAIGASRRRVARQVVVECLVLALLGGAAGLLVAQALARLLLPALNLGSEATLDLRIDWTVAAFTTVIAVASGVIFGLAPAWRASGANATIVGLGTLTSRGPTDAPRLRLGRVLLVAQIALSLALVFTATLFVQSLRRLQHVDTGFDTRNLLLIQANPVLNGYDEARALSYSRNGLDAIRKLTGVEHATITTHPLIANAGSISELRYKTPDGEEKQEQRVYRLSVADDFFETMRIPIRLGRRIDSRDANPGVRAAVINETLARRAFAGTSPLGQHFQFGSRPNAPVYEIVGVAADARYSGLRQEVPAVAYLALAENASPGSITFYVRTGQEPGRVARAIDEVMPRVDPSVPIFGMRTQEQQVAEYLSQDLFFARLGSVLGGVALLLACIGIYGLLSYSLARRTPELGVRLALGAAPSALTWLVLRESLVLAISGVVVGIPAAIAIAQAARSTLFEVRPGSPLALAAATAVLAGVALLAGYLPARRASRVDPLTALRAE